MYKYRCKSLNNRFTKGIQNKHHAQVGFILGMQMYFNIENILKPHEQIKEGKAQGHLRDVEIL